MPARKRATPRRIDPSSATKIQKTFCVSAAHGVYVEGVDCLGTSSTTTIGEGVVASGPLVEISSSVENDPVPVKSRRRCKKIVKVVQESLPCNKLVPALIASVCSVSRPIRNDVYCSFPILHPYMKSVYVDDILQSKSDIIGGGADGRGSSELEALRSGSILIGVLVCELFEGKLELGGIFRNGRHSLQFNLATCKLENDVPRTWVIKLEVGEVKRYLPVKMDPRLANIPLMELEDLLGRISQRVKLFLADDSTSQVSSLCLELWAIDQLCKFDSPSEPSGKMRCWRSLGSLGTYIVSLVKLLYPEWTEKEQQNDLAGVPNILKSSSSVVTQVQQFYKNIQLGRRSKEQLPTLPYIPGLLTQLRNYQSQAVAWMLKREGRGEGGGGGGGDGGGDPDNGKTLHMLWRKLPTKSLYFNPHTSRFSSVFFPTPPEALGGILADEMGLGKTVEMLTLILIHKWPGMESSIISHSTNPNSHAADTDSDSHVTHPENVESSIATSSDGGVVLCLCGAIEAKPGDMLVECERCLKWQHVHCSGYSEEDGDHFICIKCLLVDPLPCRTTLIVCPEAIFKQWQEEIQKHTSPFALKVLMYPGVVKRYISPLKLSCCDIVLATYESLRSELYHVTSQDFYKKLRHPKRFGCLPSPLPALHWWRICLDEAQMVENTTVRAAEMMQKLSAVNRWCVTGTPVQRDLRDLYGLLVFLGEDPYYISQWYQQLLWRPLLKGNDVPILSVFSRLMWRNSKADVADELQLPDQTEEIHWVVFSDVEEYFYRRQQETCVSRITGIRDADTALSSMAPSALKEFLTPLHSLRQACCTPQIVKTGYLPQDLSKVVITMEDLLCKLVQQAKVEAREALRQLVSNLNGLAGLHMLAHELSEAVSYYREAISLWKQYKEQDIDCDKLQRIHTLENLASLLKGDSRGLDDVDDLMAEAKTLRLEYLKKADDNTRAATEVLTAAREVVNDARKNIDLSTSQFYQQHKKTIKHSSIPWWQFLAIWCSENGRVEELVDVVNMELSLHLDHTSNSRTLSCQSIHGLECFLSLRMEAIESAREEAWSSLEALSNEPSPEQVERAVTCHMNPSGYVSKCECCLTEKKAVDYESQLFSHFSGSVKHSKAGHGEGSRFPSVCEHVLKCMLLFARRNGLPEELVSAGQCLMVYLESLRKEYPAMRSLWMTLEQRLGIHHELQQASTRLLAVTDHEFIDNINLSHGTVHQSEIPFQVVNMKLQREQCHSKLKKSIQQVSYLRNLEKSQRQKESNKEPCPICTSEMGTEWAVFPCGHSLCKECMETLIKRRHGGPSSSNVCLHCALCRESCLSSEVNYVRLDAGNDREGEAKEEGERSENMEREEEVLVNTDHASKILAVTRLLLKIQKNEPLAKALVFSSWLDVLGHISVCLSENQIPHLVLKDTATFQARLSSFKSSGHVNVLLLPFQSGARGLNITEATHVLLVEPLLNISAELQAIGRVHRMGQTRPTTVHRFLVRNSVEERIYTFFHSSQCTTCPDLPLDDSASNLTCGDVRDLMMGEP